MAYKYVKATIVAVRPMFNGKSVPLSVWEHLATAGGQQISDNFRLDRKELEVFLAGGSSFKKARAKAEAMAAKPLAGYKTFGLADGDPNWLVDVIYSNA